MVALEKLISEVAGVVDSMIRRAASIEKEAYQSRFYIQGEVDFLREKSLELKKIMNNYYNGQKHTLG